jgi:cytochrome c biogenesis protein CcdA
MNLTTHSVLAFALGIALFHNVGIAFVITIGAVIPDLDREYLLVVKDFIGRHQLHRSLFHNFLLIGILYILKPFLASGALSHSLLDSLTSARHGRRIIFPF